MFHYPQILQKVDVPPENDPQESRGQRAADALALLVGSWRFIIVQSMLLVLWIILNVVSFTSHWDPYPFILMNLVLSTQAAFTAPIIMMSQNRQAKKDRLEAHSDYLVDQQAESDVRAVIDHLHLQDEAIKELTACVQEMRAELRAVQGIAPVQPTPADAS